MLGVTMVSGYGQPDLIFSSPCICHTVERIMQMMSAGLLAFSVSGLQYA